MGMTAVCTTIAPYLLDREREYWDRWSHNADEVRRLAKETRNQDLRYFCALEVDARGLKPYEDAGFMKELSRIGAEFWTFSFDDNSSEYHTGNRVVRITMGQNISRHFAAETGADHLLFLAADCAIPDNGVDAMMTIDWPLCGLDVPTYCLHGPRRYSGRSTHYPDEMIVEEHMNSAACLFMDRSVFTRLAFRVDGDKGMTDDPCFHHDALALGIPTYARHDITALHYPECIGAIETRHDARVIHRA
jgi:hypothetical protein